MNAYRIMLADDHAILRKGIRKIIEETGHINVIGEAGDGLELLRLLKTKRPDMVILDISMPNMRGIEVIKEIKSIDAGIRIIILTMHNNPDYVYLSFRAGAQGYCLKEDSDVELLEAISQIQQGKTYVSNVLAKKISEKVNEIIDAGSNHFIDPLTPREKEVLSLIAHGKKNKEIAELLYISIRTVQHHRANIMSKLDLKNTAEMVKYAFQKGYLTPTI